MLCFSWHPPITGSLLPTFTFIFSWSLHWRWWLGPFQGVTQFPWVSPIYTAGVHVIKLLFAFPPLICLLLKRSLSQEPRRVKGKWLFLPHKIIFIKYICVVSVRTFLITSDNKTNSNSFLLKREIIGLINWKVEGRNSSFSHSCIKQWHQDSLQSMPWRPHIYTHLSFHTQF